MLNQIKKLMLKLINMKGKYDFSIFRSKLIIIYLPIIYYRLLLHQYCHEHQPKQTKIINNKT